MAKKRKLTAGEGWSLVAADTDAKDQGRKPAATGNGVRVRLEKRARGKVVSVVEGLPSDPEALRALLGGVKQKCGSGGALRDDGFEIQGDHIMRIRTHLEAAGYPRILHDGKKSGL